MAKATSCKEALARWLAGPGGGVAAGEAERVELTGLCPPIDKMDSSLAALHACRHLALSTNNLDKIGNLTGLERLEVLSLGRNCLKKLENLEAVAGTLQQLWLSYNQIDRLVSRLRGSGGVHALCQHKAQGCASVVVGVPRMMYDAAATSVPPHVSLCAPSLSIPQAGIEKCSQLRVLYASNNRIKDWAEIDRLSALPELEDLLLVGNPLYNEWKENGALPQYRIEVGQAHAWHRARRALHVPCRSS